MPLIKKISIPLAILVLAIVVAGWLFKSGRLSREAGGFKKVGSAQQEQVVKPVYTCPMHPFIIKDKPGACPICGMELVKKLSEAQTAAQTPEQKQQAAMLGHVSLSPTQRVMANVATVEARQESLNREINAVGKVQFDQSRQAKVTAWIAGRIDRLHVNAVGQYVGKNHPVADIYSPELLASQQEYLLAVRSRDQLKNSPIPAISGNGDGLVASARQRLMLYGVKESQITDLERAGRPNIRLPIYTTLSGVVIEKLVQQGQYVNTGDVLFNIADLSSVWIEIEVYENEFPNVKIGQRVEIQSESFPGKPFIGRVSFIYPFLDPKTRTVKARVDMPNPGLKLKPDMFVKATIKAQLGAAIVVPVTAVMDTGKSQTVWVESSSGMFEPREVQLGQRTDDKVQVMSGLKAGDKVAISGGYLIDSEAQLKGGGGGHENMPGMNMDEKKPAAPALQPAKKDSLKMDDMKM